MSYMFADSKITQPITFVFDSKVPVTMRYGRIEYEEYPRFKSDSIDMSGMFKGSVFNEPINHWDVSTVTNMSSMFLYSQFNQPLNKWDVSKVKNMSSMFADSSFNQPLNDWVVSSVEDMENIFANCNYEEPLDKWDVSNVSNMFGIFNNVKLGPNISSWDFRKFIKWLIKERLIELELQIIDGHEIKTVETIIVIDILFQSTDDAEISGYSDLVAVLTMQIEEVLL